GTVVGLDQPGDDVKTGRLAGAVGTQQPDHLAAAHRDRNAPQNRSLSELLHQVVCDEARRERGDFRRRILQLLSRHGQVRLVLWQGGCGHVHCDGWGDGMIRLFTVPDPLALPRRRLTPVLMLTSAYSPLNWLPAFVTLTLPDSVMMSALRS